MGPPSETLFERNRPTGWPAPEGIDEIKPLILASNPLGRFKIPRIYLPPTPWKLVFWWQLHLQGAGLKLLWTRESQLRPARLLLAEYDPEMVYRAVRWMAGFRLKRPFTLNALLRLMPEFLEEYGEK